MERLSGLWERGRLRSRKGIQPLRQKEIMEQVPSWKLHFKVTKVVIADLCEFVSLEPVSLRAYGNI